MKCEIKIAMDNAAFEDSEDLELPRILRALADDLDGGGIEPMAKTLFDVNGNRVGNCVISEGGCVMTTVQRESIAQHGRNLLAIFPNATELNPVAICKKLRRLEAQGAALALRLCNGPEFPNEDDADKISDGILAKVNALLGNVHEYQPKTGAKCSCKRGVQRDNCPTCEGTGHAINFAAVRNRSPLVPIFVNRDPRGYALKIDDEWMRARPALRLHTDWGGYGILAPEIGKGGDL